MTEFRVPGRGRLDRSQAIGFTFDGRAYSGFAGDTLASALLANGVRLVGRSFKYHRPRGVLASGSDEPNAIVAIDRGDGRYEPNKRATTQELFDGLAADSQNRWPSLRFDAGAISDIVHRLIPPGFYYKTFMWPKGFWRTIYEPLIRRASGLGRAPSQADPDVYSARYAHCEVLVVGGGAAGIAAAVAASRRGVRTVLVDEQAEIGGALLSDPSASIDGKSASEWVANAYAELRSRENVTVLTRTTAIGAYHKNMIVLVERITDHLARPPAGAPRERLWRVRAREVVLAQGATERPLVFDGNDRPGVMLAGAARTYLNRYGVAVGKRVVIVTNDDWAWLSAFDLASAGITIAAIVDLRPQIAEAIATRAARLGIEVLSGSTIAGTRGRLRLKTVDVTDTRSPTRRRIDCDTLLMSGGWTPNVHLFSHSRGTLRWRDDIQAHVPGTSPERISVVGAANGTFALDRALAEGAVAGNRAAGGSDASLPPSQSGAMSSPPTWPDDGGRAFVDFQNDVTAADLRLAVQEGFRSLEHVKRYTTVGMATDQGRTAGTNSATIVARALGVPDRDVALTTFRPPYTPTTFGTLVGHSRGAMSAVLRQTPTDDWATRHGAVFEPVGLWRRARYFPRPGEDMHAAVARECLAVRTSVGICDASTLGKIAVVGPDAAEFLNRMYVNDWSRLAPGRCRYGLLLGDDGFILDDGVVGRLSDDEFHVTTTSGGVGRVLDLMEDFSQTLWPDLRVWLTPVTEQWAVIGVNGPDSRRLLQPLVEGVDLSAEAFPHMSIRDGRIDGVPVRIFRVSFTGELGYEVNVPAGAASAIWDKLLAAGGDRLCVYGTEAMHVLRAEKGYIIPGQDTDGTVTPDDAGLGWAIGKHKLDFVGKRSLVRPAMLAADRKQLVGLLTEDPEVVLEEGAQVVDSVAGALSIGHISSSYWSAALKRSIALAMIKSGRRRFGTTVHVPMPGRTYASKVTSPTFYDPSGDRLNG